MLQTDSERESESVRESMGDGTVGDARAARSRNVTLVVCFVFVYVCFFFGRCNTLSIVLFVCFWNGKAGNVFFVFFLTLSR